MDLVFARSAFRHGVSQAQIQYVVDHCGLAFDEPAPPGASVPDDRSLYLGDDERGTALEVVAIPLDMGAHLVVHAMKVRKSYRDRYNEALLHRRLA